MMEREHNGERCLACVYRGETTEVFKRRPFKNGPLETDHITICRLDDEMSWRLVQGRCTHRPIKFEARPEAKT